MTTDFVFYAYKHQPNLAEDLILKYMREVCIYPTLVCASDALNRSIGHTAPVCATFSAIRDQSGHASVDITANLKGAVAKAQVPKILQTLVDKGELTQKVVGNEYSSFALSNLSRASRKIVFLRDQSSKPAGPFRFRKNPYWMV